MNSYTEIRYRYALQQGDNTLILAQRLSEWCGHGPALEQDIALSNIALDLLGQARMWLSYAAELEGRNRTEDDLAFLRDEREFRNVLLVEQPNGHWGTTILRQFFYDAYSYYCYQALRDSADERMAAIAEKAIKETTYHLRFSSEWTIRLGDGTDESRQKMQEALDVLWPYTGELCIPGEVDRIACEQGIAPDLNAIKGKWLQKVSEVLEEAHLNAPADTYMHTGGKEGLHTEHLGHILPEMQFLQRAYPGAKW
ncbi:MAG: 1,2-phenylacetyl-CoA epoxidase subunit PaaC [Saprospiraceae bacterium]